MVSSERLTETIISEILPIQKSAAFTHEGQFDWI